MVGTWILSLHFVCTTTVPPSWWWCTWELRKKTRATAKTKKSVPRINLCSLVHMISWHISTGKCVHTSFRAACNKLDHEKLQPRKWRAPLFLTRSSPKCTNEPAQNPSLLLVVYALATQDAVRGLVVPRMGALPQHFTVSTVHSMIQQQCIASLALVSVVVTSW
jgi:hypothetical protein